MSCSRTVSHSAEISAAEYWALKDDPNWAAFQDAQEGTERTVLLDKTDADGTRTVRAQVTASENPIPQSLRRMLGCGESFSFTVTESWLPNKWGKKNAAVFATEPAVLSSKIKVGGSHWVSESSDAPGRCTLHFQLDVQVRVMGVGDKLAKGILSGTVGSYAQIPTRVTEFIATRAAERAAASVADPTQKTTKSKPRPKMGRGAKLSGTSKALADAVMDIRAAEQDAAAESTLVDVADATSSVHTAPFSTPRGTELLAQVQTALIEVRALKARAVALVEEERKAFVAFELHDVDDDELEQPAESAPIREKARSRERSRDR